MPSSGSTIQRSPLEPASSPPSSPRKPSSGRAAGSRERISVLAPPRRPPTRGRSACSWPRPARRAAERLQQLGARLAGDLLGELAQAHGAAGGPVVGPAALALELRGQREQRALAAGRPDELHAEREPVAGEAGRHRGGGLAGVVEDRLVGRVARDAVERPERRAALVGEHRRRAVDERRREHDVEAVVEHAADALAVGRLAAPGRGPARRAGSAPPSRMKPRVRRARRSGCSTVPPSSWMPRR